MMEDVFNTEPQEPITMGQNEFFDKSKLMAEKILNAYSKSWMTQRLSEDEYPDESVCNLCGGCGIFKRNGFERDCYQDKEQGECYHKFCDYENLGIEIEEMMSDITTIVLVESLTPPPQSVYDMYANFINQTGYELSAVQADNIQLVLLHLYSQHFTDVEFVLSADEEILIEKTTDRGVHYLILDKNDSRLFYALSGYNEGDIGLEYWENTSINIKRVCEMFSRI